jgi:flagellar protein FliO/FliZ
MPPTQFKGMYTQQERKKLTEILKAKSRYLTQRLRFLSISAALLVCGTSQAQETAPAATTTPAAQSMAGNTLQATLILLFVLALLLGLLWFLKRMGVGTGQRRGGFYKVLATSALGPREKIVLIEVGDTWLVLGMTSSSINTLHSMPAGSIALNSAQNHAVDFAKMLERIKTGKIKST